MAGIYELTDTWNSGGTTFAAIKMNVTDTASASGSKLLDLQVGAVEKFAVTKTGAVRVPGDFSVNTDKFVITASSGNTVIAGTASIAGDVAINTDKFTVTAASGNTVIAGTLDVTGNVATSGTLACDTSLTIGSTTITEAQLIALLATLE